MSEEQMLNWAMQIAAAEEMARAKIVVKPEVKVAPTPPKTIVKKETDFKIPDTLIDMRGIGCLKELLIKSAFKEYRLYLYADGQQLYADTWDGFSELSQEIDEIAAFQTEDGVYVLHLYDIKFSESIKVVIEPVIYIMGEPPTISQIFYKLDVAS